MYGFLLKQLRLPSSKYPPILVRIIHSISCTPPCLMQVSKHWLISFLMTLPRANKLRLSLCKLANSIATHGLVKQQETSATYKSSLKNKVRSLLWLIFYYSILKVRYIPNYVTVVSKVFSLIKTDSMIRQVMYLTLGLCLKKAYKRQRLSTM